VRRRSGRAGGCSLWRVGRVAAIVLMCLVVPACTGSRSDSVPTPEPRTPAAPVARDYWPTAGWRTAAPNVQGVDATRLATIKDQVAKAYPQVRSVLVVRHGYLVYEHYWHGLDQTSGQDLRSVTKSFVGALVGIALAEGKITSLDETVGELLPTQLPPDADPRFAEVTVKDLLTMTSGLAGDDERTGGDARLTEALEESPDWVRHILSQPLVTDPGTHFAYSNASAHLLSAIVANSSQQSTLDYARTNLLTSLGIRTDQALEPRVTERSDPAAVKAYQRAAVAWIADPQGYDYGAGALRLPARDLAKLGYLYLNGGRWDTTQVIPADYVAAATSPTGASPNLTMGYGWLWWVSSEYGHHTFSARGAGGQYIWVVPDLDLVTVVTSNPDANGIDPKVLIRQTIVPAVTG
jgi:CubicO group peptidase (beta-lactamase class C family)